MSPSDDVTPPIDNFPSFPHTPSRKARQDSLGNRLLAHCTLSSAFSSPFRIQGQIGEFTDCKTFTTSIRKRKMCLPSNSAATYRVVSGNAKYLGSFILFRLAQVLLVVESQNKKFTNSRGDRQRNGSVSSSVNITSKAITYLQGQLSISFV